MEDKVEIVDYKEAYGTAFRDLNVEWISHYFEMESSDYKVLDHPQTSIIEPGGHIYIALLNGEAVGACALMKLENHRYEYELSKMAVSPLAQGNGIGLLLGQAVINKAKGLGAKNIYLETNDRLAPALRLYGKLGFTKVDACETPYSRCNVQMMLAF